MRSRPAGSGHLDQSLGAVWSDSDSMVGARPASANDGAPGNWNIARFRNCEVHRCQRELTCGGVRRPIEPQAFDVLLFLIDQRHRSSTKDDILRHCWGEDTPTDAALARTIMKIRQAIGDFDVAAPLIETVRRVGYRFAANVETSCEVEPLAPALPEVATAQRRRLALLPGVNETGDQTLAWCELGLMSLIAKSLQSLVSIAIVPVRDTLLSLSGLPKHVAIDKQLEAVQSAFGATLCAWWHLCGTQSCMQLNFSLRQENMQLLSGTVVGTDPAKMAMAAASRMREWLGDAKPDVGPEWSIDLGDDFLNQAFVRALQCIRDERLIEADNLLELLRQSDAHHPWVLHESARVQVALGKPQALAALQHLDAIAFQTRDTYLQACVPALRGRFLEREGAVNEAVRETLLAVDLAERHGLSNLAVRLMVTCAGQMAMASDKRAEVMLSRAIPVAEHLGNRVLLCDAYCAAARIAGFRHDWLTAVRHQDAAVAIARTMHEASRSLAYGGLSWIQTALGQLDEAATSASIAFATARLSGGQPQQGLAAGQAALAYMASRRVRDLLDLYRTLRTMSHDTSTAMRVARDVYCRAYLLAAIGRVDEATRTISAATAASAKHPRLLTRCQGEHIRMLVQSRRFEELGRYIGALRTDRRDRRLGSLIEWALAFRDYLGCGRLDAGMERLQRIVSTQTASEAFARASLDVAWLYLERDDPNAAARAAAPVRLWLEQSQPGMLVAARLRFAQGDAAEAVTLQEACLDRYRDTTTSFQHELLDCYRRARRGIAVAALPRIDEPINLHWRLSIEARAEVSAELDKLDEN